MRNIRNRNLVLRSGQRGALTMFSAVLILILLTEMIIYAVQVGVFEQRKSGNDMMQKLAFHSADSGVQHAKQFLTANADFVASSSLSGGWLAPGTLRWLPCSGVDTSADRGTHPCYGEPLHGQTVDGVTHPDLRANTYFYSLDDSDELPIDSDALTDSTSERITQHALLCMLEINRDNALLEPPQPIVEGCTTDPARQDNRYFLITLLSRGEADCVGNNCNAEALIAQKIGSFGPGGGTGGPGAPLTARTAVPLSGTVEIVPNPNGGGLGVPISTWANARTEDPPGFDGCALSEDAVSPDSGSYATCERHEYYGVDEYPSDFKCPGGNTNCSCSKTEDRLISYADGNERILGNDILYDTQFPCDLWQHLFLHDKYADPNPTKEAARVKGRVLTDCSSLDETSAGFYWISGNTCDIKNQIGDHGNETVGGPVFLISAASNTKITAGAEIFGVLLVTDLEDSGAEFTGNGHGTVYGAAIMDASMEHFNGTFQIVYLENMIQQGVETGSFGAVLGGWTDFHTSWQ